MKTDSFEVGKDPTRTPVSSGSNTPTSTRLLTPSGTVPFSTKIRDGVDGVPLSDRGPDRENLHPLWGPRTDTHGVDECLNGINPTSLLPSSRMKRYSVWSQRREKSGRDGGSAELVVLSPHRTPLFWSPTVTPTVQVGPLRGGTSRPKGRVTRHRPAPPQGMSSVTDLVCVKELHVDLCPPLLTTEMTDKMMK